MNFVVNSSFVLNLYLVFLLVSSLNTCNSNTSTASNYDAEVINYFYETAYHTDDGELIENSQKWKKDIYISLTGNVTNNDLTFVNEVIQEINQLSLPIKLKLSPNDSLTNLNVYFGDLTDIVDFVNKASIGKSNAINTNFSGIGQINQYSGVIESAVIGIANDSKIYSTVDSVTRLKIRKHLILEEIFQCLGIPGDSFTFYNSIVYEGNNFPTNLSDIDRKILSFLYLDNYFLNNVPKKQYEKDFRFILYKNISTETVKSLSVKYNIDYDSSLWLKSVINLNTNNNSIFYKFPRKLFLRFDSSFSEMDLIFIEKLVDNLNNNVNNLNIEYVKYNSIENEYPSISINLQTFYSDAPHIKLDFEYSEHPMTMMMRYNFYSCVNINLYGPDISNNFYREEILTNVIFKVLGVSTSESLIEIYNSDKFIIKQKFLNVLNFLYDPCFPSGITSTKINQIIK